MPRRASKRLRIVRRNLDRASQAETARAADDWDVDGMSRQRSWEKQRMVFVCVCTIVESRVLGKPG